MSSSLLKLGAPTEIRTPVLALKGLRPSPLDDGGELRDFTTAITTGQVWRDFPYFENKSFHFVDSHGIIHPRAAMGGFILSENFE